MRPLEINDMCYKFFFTNGTSTEGPRSLVYEAWKLYSASNKLFFFRRDEAISSLRELLYFMKYGDALAEIIVDKSLIDNAMEVSPNHFAVDSFTVGEIYDGSSVEVLKLVMSALRNCNDFTIVRFQDIIIKLINIKGFDSALSVYETISREKNLCLSEFERRIIMESGRQPWCGEISISDVRGCSNMEEYINLMKSRINGVHI